MKSTDESTTLKGHSISCLVVSKNEKLIKRMLDSLLKARLKWNDDDEILCSWNGSTEESIKLEDNYKFKSPCFKICQHEPYHFAQNINSLSTKAKGDILILLNDDLILDPLSLDKGLRILNTYPKIGIVGARLRNSDGLLTHAGLLFSKNGIPYNRLRPDQLIPLIKHDLLDAKYSGLMPAVTGALMFIRKRDFLKVNFRTEFDVCGEDVALCLDFWEKLHLSTYYSSEITSIHNEKSTRGNTYDYNDIEKISAIYKSLINRRPDFIQNINFLTVNESEFMWKLAQSLSDDLKKSDDLLTQLNQVKTDFDLSKKHSDDLLTQLSQVKTDLGHSKKHSNNLLTQLNQVKTDFDLSKKHSDDLLTQLSQVKIDLDLSKKHSDDLLTKINQEKAYLENQFIEKDLDLEESNHHLEASKIYAADLLSQLELTKGYVEDLTNKCNDLANKLDEVHKSYSWLITKPFRAISRLLNLNKIKNNTPLLLNENETYKSIESDKEDVEIRNDITNKPLIINKLIDIKNSDETFRIPRKTSDLNIIFDVLVIGHANQANVSRGGIFRYSSELLIGMESNSKANIFPFIKDWDYAEPAQNELDKLRQFNSIGSRSKHSTKSSKYNQTSFNSFQKQFSTCNSLNTIFHTPFQFIPDEVRDSNIRSCIVTIHDMIPNIFPETFPDETIRQFHLLLKNLKKEDHVICVSESTKQDFIKYNSKIPEENVHVTHLASSKIIQEIKDQELKEQFKNSLGLLNHEKIILSLCTLEPRKNLITLIEAFEKLNEIDRSIKLVLAGTLGWKSNSLIEKINSSKAFDSIIQTGYITDSDLSILYSIADVFVYPSIYEGFGLPILEAMQCGTPCVAGNHSSIPEVAGDAALLIDVKSVNELQLAVSKIIESSKISKMLRKKGLQQSSKFNWRNTAKTTLSVYLNSLNR